MNNDLSKFQIMKVYSLSLYSQIKEMFGASKKLLSRYLRLAEKERKTVWNWLLCTPCLNIFKEYYFEESAFEQNYFGSNKTLL